MPDDSIHWNDIEEIGIRLAETHPSRDPLSVRFTELKTLVEALPGFSEEPGHPANESILEAIQKAWYEESQDVERDEDDKGYRPPTPFRPD